MSSPAANPLHQYRTSRSVRHSKDRALNEREFELLLEGASQLSESPYYYAPDPPLVIYALGRLGMRRGELAHLREQWINWRQKTIEIPPQSSCNMGPDGEVCGSCRQLARQRVDHADGLTLDEALEHMWAPKTEAGARAIYYGHDTRAEMYLERYFDNDAYTRFEASGTAIGRRVKKAAENARELEPEDVHPHGLRATTATHLAGKGLGIYQLMQFMGWERASTAQAYVSRNSMNTAKALDSLDSV